MSKNTRQNILIYSCSAILLLILGIGFFLATRTSQTKMSIERTTGVIGQFAVSPSPHFMEIRPGLMFKVDTGSDVSTITEHDLAVLDSLGFKAQEMYYPVLGRNGIGDTHLYTKRYRVSLPLYQWKTAIDSSGTLIHTCLYNTQNIINNIDFVKSETGFSVLGIDFLENFKLEHRIHSRTVSLYLEEPQGYEFCTDLIESSLLFDIITLSHRYYMNCRIDNDPNQYFLDTGLQRAFIKRPSNEITPGGRRLKKEQTRSLRGVYDAVSDPDAWIEIGNRQGPATVYYYDTDEETHAINPINMLNFDILIDFPNRKIMLRQ